VTTKMSSFQQIVQGLQIFETYLDAKNKGDISAEHDEIYVSGVHWDAVGGDDRKKLKAMGWSWDDSFNAWHRFV